MKNSWKLGGAVVVAAAAILAVVGVARAQQKHSVSDVPPEGSTLSMSKFYSGAGESTGNFPGRLVCLRCDLKPGPNAMQQCQKEGHRHALAMESDSMIHPLLAGTPVVLKEINSAQLHDKQVIVHGKYYPSTGATLVDSIREAK